MFAGFRYIRHQPIVLGAISLDLFAVLLGGVTALLPIYARDILEAGPWGAGPVAISTGGGCAGDPRSCSPTTSIAGHAGRIMFVAVGRFGLATLIFGLSTSIVLSFLALVIYGASDAVSVVIRQSLVQLRTPHDMLGRVMAVNSMCTGSSGTLGEFRAGAVAAWLGAVPAVLMGGSGTIVVMLIWMWAFPQLRRVGKLTPESVRHQRPCKTAPTRSNPTLPPMPTSRRSWGRRGNSGWRPTRSNGTSAGIRGRTAYTRIARVRLSFRPVTMQTRRFVTEIWPVDSPRILIASSSWKSILEQEGRDQAYGAFIREPHRRILASGARVTFEAGSPAILYWLGLAVFVIVSLGLAALTVRALQAAAWPGGRHYRRYALLVRMAKWHLFSPQPSGQPSPGSVAGASRAAASQLPMFTRRRTDGSTICAPSSVVRPQLRTTSTEHLA